MTVLKVVMYEDFLTVKIAVRSRVFSRPGYPQGLYPPNLSPLEEGLIVSVFSPLLRSCVIDFSPPGPVEPGMQSRPTSAANAVLLVRLSKVNRKIFFICTLLMVFSTLVGRNYERAKLQ
jgi:hypothetical protein